MRAEGLLALALAALAAAPAGGQEAEPGDPASEAAVYAVDGRRDPFVPLVSVDGQDAEGPRFDRLTLTGIFLGAPGNSLVVLEDPMRRGHFVRAGEVIGNARLLEIGSQSAVFEVEDFGVARRVTLRLERDAGGGGGR